MSVLARNTDPATSHHGAVDVADRAPTQKERLLSVYASHPSGLTADEAGRLAGLLHTGYWKRCSDLARDGLIEPLLVDGHPMHRRGIAGSDQQVRVITRLGRRQVP